MKNFMDNDFLLSTTTAIKLYHEYAEKMPIIDYHCHINPKDIAEDIRFENITKLWLGGDHYKWRLMRSFGIDEKYITGDADDHDKFIKWAYCLGKSIGNPLYHWSHLELRNYFGYKGFLNEKTAEEVWNMCNRKLQESDMSSRKIIEKSGVKIICTTDDPVDSLSYHKVIREDSSFSVRVLPAWRPDNAMNIAKDEFTGYINKLGTLTNEQINTFSSLCQALSKRMDYFEEMGCRVSDHGLDYIYYSPVSTEETELIFSKRMNNQILTDEEVNKFKCAIMQFMGFECSHRDWVMQLHFGCKRNNNTKMYSLLGADTGYDCINNRTLSSDIANYLDSLASKDCLPKTILYSLNPEDNAAIGTILGCFQDSTHVGKIQQGSAWWFNDHKDGIRNQLLSLASLGNLSGFVGMLTDSRSFLSYARHEYFRRILCDIIGSLVENGEYPEDYDTLREIINDICFNNSIRYFGFDRFI